jgi:hypothetical protein
VSKSEVWVYPSDGRPPYIKGSAQDVVRAPMIMGDLPDFVSPIDQKVVSGRAGMREHNLRHNVVPTADLAGLPYLNPHYNETRSKSEIQRDRQSRKETIIHKVNQHYR